MTHKVLTGAIVASFSFFSLSISAQNASTRSEHRQEVIETVRVHHPGGEADTSADSIKSLIENFYLDQFRQFHDPDAPTFMLMSKDANIALGVGGKAIVRGWADWNGSQSSPSFYPYSIAIPKDPTAMRSFDASFDKTSLFVSLLGRSAKIRYMVYLQAEVSNSNFILKKAYINLNDFTVGLASTTFSDDDALAPTVDAQGPNGKTSKTQILGRYFHTFSNGFSLAGAVEVPNSYQASVEGQTAPCTDFIPDIVALAQYGWGDSHVRASGIMRTMTYRDLLTETNHNVIGWGAQLSTVIDIARPLTFYFTAVGGRGIGSYQGDLSKGQYDLVGDSRHPGKMIAPWSMGITTGLKYQLSPKVFSSVSFGQQRYFLKHRLTDDQYKYGLYGAANVFWKISPRFLAGLEYIVGKRMNYNHTHGAQNRVDAMVSYSF